MRLARAFVFLDKTSSSAGRRDNHRLEAARNRSDVADIISLAQHQRLRIAAPDISAEA